MIFEEINFTPPLKMGRAIWRRIKRVSRHSNELKPKSFSKNFIKVKLKKQQIDYENLEGKETMKQKWKPLGETFKKNTKYHLDIS
jgi:hypothetical protein